MATNMLKTSKQVIQLFAKHDHCPFLQQVRTKFPWKHGGLRPELARTWKQRVEEIEKKDPVLDAPVNIGFPLAIKKLTRSEHRKLKNDMSRDLATLERKARYRELILPLEEIREEQFEGLGQARIHTIAEHYGIYRDLFSEGHFYPQFEMKVCYEVEGEEDLVNPVFYGNTLTPMETKKEPHIDYVGNPDKLYTLCLTAPDSHLQDNQMEYLHWMVGNIPGSSVKDGEELCNYLPLFPVKGTGYHRYVFILYQQGKKIDFLEFQKSKPCISLAQRTFKSRDFYHKLQDDLTPVGLSFFQSEWDPSVRETFHTVLDMNEPWFEFLPPPPYVPKQELWPIREPFHVYMDRYRDVKDIKEEVLREKLRMADPFKPRPLPPKYPKLYKIHGYMPSWLQLKLDEKYARQSYWKELED